MSSTTSAVDESLFWNRETSSSVSNENNEDISKFPVCQTARIISLSKPNDPACQTLHQAALPAGAEVLQIGQAHDDFDVPRLIEQKVNVIFVSPGPTVRSTLARLLTELPSIEWVHSRMAGIDSFTSPELESFVGPVTNAKGQFSSTLAEYTLMACAYFAKDLPRLLRNKKNKEWDRYNILELRGATMGIFGYGDIGKACARLAKAYGMKVIAIRRNVNTAAPDSSLCDAIYPPSELNRLFVESDYIVCAAPLTAETEHVIGATQFNAITRKNKAVFINVGRGPIVQQDDLIEALQNGQLRGAGLDVFAQEPLDPASKLWELDNVLISPHNMDQTATFMHESTEFFVNLQLPRFLRNQPLFNPVNPKNGY